MTSINTVLLDLDGTLVDSVFVHAVTWKAAFRDVGLNVPTHHLQRSIGMGVDRLVTHVAGESAERAVGDEARSRHDTHLDERFGEIVPTDGAAELLETLKSRGLTLVLASSAPKELSERLLEVLDGAGRHLDRTVAGGEADASKPAGDLLEVALDSVDAESAVMIGDTVWDVKAAQDAGVRCIGLLTGGVSEAELREAGAVEVYDSPRDLLDHLDQSVITR